MKNILLLRPKHEQEQTTAICSVFPLPLSMAFLANGCSSIVVFPNRTLTSLLTFSFSNLPKHHRPSSSNNHPYPRMTISASSSDVQPQHSINDFQPTPSTSKTWSEFAKNVSGEWDGYGADFTNEGKPTELPEYVVPEAYREWEVKVFDWQTQCPTLAQPEDHLLLTKLIKLLPTVGCEADAATRYTVEERNVGGADSKVSAFAYQSGGSYVAVWPMEEVDYKGTVKDELLELEHCLVDPRNRESRVRVIQVVVVDGSKLVLRSIKVFCEQYYGPFRNGDQLGGCAIRDSAFASTVALKSSQVTGVWQARNSIARFQTPPHTKLIEELVDDDSVQNFARDEGDLILLPKQLWCSLKETEDGETCSEVGWLFDQGRAITCRCIFSSDSKLKEIALACESAALEGL